MIPPLAVTLGDPAGVGPELTLKAWEALRDTDKCFFVLGDPRLYGPSALTISSPTLAVEHFSHRLPVYPVVLQAEAEPGKPNTRHAGPILTSIQTAVELAASGLSSGIITNPIAKSVLYEAGFKHPGHTEFIAMLTQNLKQAGPRGPIMMLAGDRLRVALVSIHTALKDAIESLSVVTIVDCARIVHHALRMDFGIQSPRLAVAGLNPHAGENGTLGREEVDIVIPAIEHLQREGIDATGPYAPDAMFHEEARTQYDAAICLYHDQGLIPFKALDFWGGVNVTLGLPIVRTSPDHGTGFDIAGKGIARADSLIAAIKMASDIATRRAS